MNNPESSSITVTITGEEVIEADQVDADEKVNKVSKPDSFPSLAVLSQEERRVSYSHNIFFLI